MLEMVSTKSLKSLVLAPATQIPTGTPLPSTRSERLVPALARSVGLGPVFFPRQRTLGHRSIHTQPTPVDALEGVILRQARLPEAQKEACLYPLLKAVVRRGTRAQPGFRERVPLAARSQDKEDAIGTHPIRRPWPPAAKAVSVLVRGQERLHERPELIADRKASTGTRDASGMRTRAWRLHAGHLLLPCFHTNSDTSSRYSVQLFG